MIIIKNGDLLKCNEDIIVHQCNIDAILGGGIAKQLAEKYPMAEREYMKICREYKNNYENLKGKIDLTLENGKYIASIFSQDKHFNTDYEAMRQALELVKGFAKQENLSVALPYGMGAGIANGDFNKVLEVIEEVFSDYCVSLYKLENKNQFGNSFKEIIIDEFIQ